MDLRNKTTSEFRTVFGSPLGVPNSQVPLYIYPICIMGPSGPTGSPAPTAQTHEKNLTTKVLRLSTCRIIVPFRKPITSGIPEPAAGIQKN